MDTLTKKQRSHRMSLIGGKDTKPEKSVRRLVHGLGYRYRLHDEKLPGKPDLVFRSRKKIIFIHGCFWHRHPSGRCALARLPKSRRSFWIAKLNANRRRDLRTQAQLRRMGWRILIVWECEIVDLHRVEGRVKDFLDRLESAQL